MKATQNLPARRGGRNLVDRTGERYGRLVVIERAGSRGTNAAWLCRCDCGTDKVIAAPQLRAGYSRSCGCSRKTGRGSRPYYTTKFPAGVSARNTVLKGYRHQAKARGYVWKLTDEEFDVLTAANCTYCGVEPSTVSKPSRNGSFTYNGIDRIDNARGYVSDNVVTSCYRCNHAKRDLSHSDFMDWIKRIAGFHGAAMAA